MKSPQLPVRFMMSMALLVAVAVSLGFTRPVAAETLPEAKRPFTITLDPVGDSTAAAFIPAQRRTLGTTVLDTNFLDDQVHIQVQVISRNLKGSKIRAGVFFFYANAETMEADSSAPQSFVTSDGSLTQQLVYRAAYTNSKWKGDFYIPYQYFPAVSSRTRGFIQAQSGVDGQEFVSFSERIYFTISP
jgi:hypothetical protein